MRIGLRNFSKHLPNIAPVIGVVLGIAIYNYTPLFLIPSAIILVIWVMGLALKTKPNDVLDDIENPESDEIVVQAGEDPENGTRLSAKGMSDN